MVVGLLFLGLAFFAVGQAGATRNGAQSGADAAALAAAQESRDRLGADLAEGILDPDFLSDFLDGGARDLPGSGCAEAGRLAAANGTLIADPGCASLGDGRWGYTVTVRSQEPVGDTVLPGTESAHAEATAVAVVEPRCTFEPAAEKPPSEPSEPPATGPPDGEPSPGGEESPPPEDEPTSPGALHCDGEVVDIDPERPDDLPDMSDLFTVRLDGD